MIESRGVIYEEVSIVSHTGGRFNLIVVIVVVWREAQRQPKITFSFFRQFHNSADAIDIEPY